VGTEQVEEPLLPGAQHQLDRLRGIQRLDAQPHPFQGLPQALGGAFQPARAIFPGLRCPAESCAMARPLLPVIFVDREDVVGIETASIQLPERQRTAGAAIAIGEGMDRSWERALGSASSRPPSSVRTCSRGNGLPSMAVDAWTLRDRASFCRAGTQGAATAAPWIRSRSVAMASTQVSSVDEMIKRGSYAMARSDFKSSLSPKLRCLNP